MKITPEENETLFALLSEFNYPDFDPTKHVTSTIMAEQWGMKSSKGAYERLEGLVHEGKLSKEKVRMESGRIGWGYFKAQ